MRHNVNVGQRLASLLGSMSLALGLSSAAARAQTPVDESAPAMPTEPGTGQEVTIRLQGTPAQIEEAMRVLQSMNGVFVESPGEGYLSDRRGDPTWDSRSYAPTGTVRVPSSFHYRSYRGRSYNYGYPFYDYGGLFAQGFDAGYRQGRFDGRREMELELSAPGSGLIYNHALTSAADSLAIGDYGGAARQYLLAAGEDQGDAFSRLHAGHALVALGRYAEAVGILQRALELQPRLVYRGVNIERDYASPEDFAETLAKLKAAAEAQANDATLWTLLGYYQFFSGRHEEALNSLVRATHLSPQQKLATRLLEVARISVPKEN